MLSLGPIREGFNKKRDKLGLLGEVRGEGSKRVSKAQSGYMFTF